MTKVDKKLVRLYTSNLEKNRISINKEDSFKNHAK